VSSGIPLAVAPSVLTPGLYLTVNLLAAASSPGTASYRALLICPRSSAGTLTANTEVRLIGGEDDAKTAFGTKSPGFLAARNFYRECPNGVLYGIAPTASGGNAATGTITFASTPTVAQTVVIDVAGHTIEVAWAASEDADTIKTRVISAINARDDIPAAASSGGTGIVTLTFPIAGPWGNDVLYSVLVKDGTGGTGTAGGSAFTGGTTEPDFTTALTTVSGERFDFIAPIVSNADGQGTGASTNVARVATHVNALNHGLDAHLQCGIIGLTGSLASTKAGAIARNDPTLEFVFCMAGRGMPAELAGEELGARMRDVMLDPAMNRIGTVFTYYPGAADLIGDKPTGPEVEDALANGVSIISYNRQGQSVLVRPITSHSQDASGNADRRCFDVSGVDGSYAVANDIQLFLPQEFPKAKISKDLAPGDEPLPEGVIEERDIKAAIITRLRTWQTRGVVRKDKLDEALAGGTLIVRVNPSDETQVDHVIPTAIFKPLAKFGVVVNKVA
jgi:phage tail sheath gpL-like